MGISNLGLEIPAQIPLAATLVKWPLDAMIVAQNPMTAHAVAELVAVHESAVTTRMRQRLFLSLALRHFPNERIHSTNRLHHLKSTRENVNNERSQTRTQNKQHYLHVKINLFRNPALLLFHSGKTLFNYSHFAI
jgi:hypothetical protein